MEETEARTKMSVSPRDIETARGLLALRCCCDVMAARNGNQVSPGSTKSLEKSADNSTKATDKSSLEIPNSDHEIDYSLKSEHMKIAWELTAMSMGYYSYPWNVRETTPEGAESIEQRIDQSTEQKDAELPRENVQQ